MNVRRTLGIILLLSSIAGTAAAEPAGTPELTSGSPVVVDADVVEYIEQEGTLRGSGHVRIDYEGVTMSSDEVLVDTKTKQAQAQGTVRLEYEQAVLTGPRLVYNFETQQGAMSGDEADASAGMASVNLEYQGSVVTTNRLEFDLRQRTAFTPGPAELVQGDSRFSGERLAYHYTEQQGELFRFNAEFPPWYGTAESVSFESRDKATFHHSYVTTCDREHPHYRIQSRRMYFYRNDKITAHHAVVYIGKIPILYLPWWRYSFNEKNAAFTLSAGRKKEWGWYLLSSWRSYINENVSATVHLDPRELRGVASGLDVAYEDTAYGNGKVKTYFMNDRNKYDEGATEEERYRGQWRHRWQMNDHTLAMLEYNKFSDADFTRDFLYKEYAEDVQPATEGSLSYATAAFNMNLYGRKRTNRFYGEIERLPELSFASSNWEIGESNVFYRTNAATVNLNQKNADTKENGHHTNRFDVYQELNYPTRLPDTFDWIRVTPFVGMRQTFYSRDIDGVNRDFWRGIHSYGVSMNTTFYRFFDIQDDFFGVQINQLRHIVKPTVQYQYTHTPTVDPDRLFAFDYIDTLHKENFYTLGLENYWQTKWRRPDDTENYDTTDLMYFFPHVDYFPQRNLQDRYFSSITMEANFQPTSWLRFDTDSVYNQYQRRFDSALLDLKVLGERWNMNVGKRYDRTVSEQLTLDWYYAFNPIWQWRTYFRYESVTEQFQQQQYTVYRDLHCWLMELTYDISLTAEGDVEDRAIWVAFRLKAFPEQTEIGLSANYDTTRRYFQ